MLGASLLSKPRRERGDLGSRAGRTHLGVTFQLRLCQAWVGSESPSASRPRPSLPFSPPSSSSAIHCPFSGLRRSHTHTPRAPSDRVPGPLTLAACAAVIVKAVKQQSAEPGNAGRAAVPPSPGAQASCLCWAGVCARREAIATSAPFASCLSLPPSLTA